MFYITSSGRIADDINLVGQEEYITRKEYPKVPEIKNQKGIIIGIDKVNDELLYRYEEIQENAEEHLLTAMEILMQAQTDAELRAFEIRQGQELLAQQMADVEIAILERGVTNA